MMRFVLAALAGAALGIAIMIGWAAFGRWGFDPASWSTQARAAWFLMALLAGVIGGVLGVGAANLARGLDR